MAAWEISRIGWRMVVSSGQIVVAMAVSSKPHTVRSSGTARTPLRRNRLAGGHGMDAAAALACTVHATAAILARRPAEAI